MRTLKAEGSDSLFNNVSFTNDVFFRVRDFGGAIVKCENARMARYVGETLRKVIQEAGCAGDICVGVNGYSEGLVCVWDKDVMMSGKSKNVIGKLMNMPEVMMTYVASNPRKEKYSSVIRESVKNIATVSNEAEKSVEEIRQEDYRLQLIHRENKQIDRIRDMVKKELTAKFVINPEVNALIRVQDEMRKNGMEIQSLGEELDLWKSLAKIE